MLRSTSLTISDLQTERNLAVSQNLLNAPIKEALIDIQFQPAASLEALDNFALKMSDEYVKKSDLWEAVIGFKSAGDATETHSHQSVIGRRLESKDGSFVLQCRSSGFTLSRLNPYTNWEDMQSTFTKVWGIFCEGLDARQISRIAVRYINELKLPLPLKDFDEYLTCSPQVPPESPQGISGFLSQVIIPDSLKECTSVITQALEQPSQETYNSGSITIILDIDVYRMVSINITNINDINSCLEILRNQKNLMFFSHITEKCVELYK
jgi:uncharacterized protein (TIGR04255 family)